MVLIGDSKKRVMIVGVCQLGGSTEKKIWDYSGVLYPEGFLDPEKMFLFNNDQITQIYALGYQDAEQIAFKEKADLKIIELRKSSGDMSREK